MRGQEAGRRHSPRDVEIDEAGRRGRRWRLIEDAAGLTLMGAAGIIEGEVQRDLQVMLDRLGETQRHRVRVNVDGGLAGRNQPVRTGINRTGQVGHSGQRSSKE